MTDDDPSHDNTLRGLLMKRKQEGGTTEHQGPPREMELIPMKRRMKSNTLDGTAAAKMKKQHAVGDLTGSNEAIDHLKTTIPSSLKG